MNERSRETPTRTGPSTPVSPLEVDAMVPCTPRAAFDYFTRDIGRWWPLARHSCSEFRAASVAFEGAAGGRLIETDVDGKRYVWGTVRVWKPGKALAFTWHPGKSADAALDVSINFVEAGTMTRVRLVHSGWDRLGDAATKTRDAYARGWPTVLGLLYRRHCEDAAAGDPQLASKTGAA